MALKLSEFDEESIFCKQSNMTMDSKSMSFILLLVVGEKRSLGVYLIPNSAFALRETKLKMTWILRCVKIQVT